jgi:hypothetical protein
MPLNFTKQPILKPQDLLVALKLAVANRNGLTFGDLAYSLHISTSEVHAATKRAELSRLVGRDDTGLIAFRSSIMEFLIHGVRYSFPAVHGGIVRGMPTGFAGPTLSTHFRTDTQILQVWPDPEGTERGVAFQPLYPTVPKAARLDSELYDILTLVDAVRGGAARERELAKTEIERRLS